MSSNSTTSTHVAAPGATRRAARSATHRARNLLIGRRRVMGTGYLNEHVRICGERERARHIDGGHDSAELCGQGRQREVGLREVATQAEQRQAGELGDGVGEAVAEVQARRVAVSYTHLRAHETR